MSSPGEVDPFDVLGLFPNCYLTREEVRGAWVRACIHVADRTVELGQSMKTVGAPYSHTQVNSARDTLGDPEGLRGSYRRWHRSHRSTWNPAAAPGSTAALQPAPPPEGHVRRYPGQPTAHADDRHKERPAGAGEDGRREDGRRGASWGAASVGPAPTYLDPRSTRRKPHAGAATGRDDAGSRPAGPDPSEVGLLLGTFAFAGGHLCANERNAVYGVVEWGHIVSFKVSRYDPAGREPAWSTFDPSRDEVTVVHEEIVYVPALHGLSEEEVAEVVRTRLAQTTPG